MRDSKLAHVVCNGDFGTREFAKPAVAHRSCLREKEIDVSDDHYAVLVLVMPWMSPFVGSYGPHSRLPYSVGNKIKKEGGKRVGFVKSRKVGRKVGMRQARLVAMLCPELAHTAGEDSVFTLPLLLRGVHRGDLLLRHTRDG